MPFAREVPFIYARDEEPLGWGSSFMYLAEEPLGRCSSFMYLVEEPLGRCSLFMYLAEEPLVIYVFGWGTSRKCFSFVFLDEVALGRCSLYMYWVKIRSGGSLQLFIGVKSHSGSALQSFIRVRYRPGGAFCLFSDWGTVRGCSSFINLGEELPGRCPYSM